MKILHYCVSQSPPPSPPHLHYKIAPKDGRQPTLKWFLYTLFLAIFFYMYFHRFTDHLFFNLWGHCSHNSLVGKRTFVHLFLPDSKELVIVIQFIHLSTILMCCSDTNVQCSSLPEIPSFDLYKTVHTVSTLSWIDF